MTEQKSPLLWRICYTLVVIISALTFTPLVIPVGQYEPMLGGVPLSLWAGIGIAFALVLLTYLGTRIHIPLNDDPAEDV